MNPLLRKQKGIFVYRIVYLIMAIAETNEELMAFRDVVIANIKLNFSYLTDVFNFHIREIEVKSSWSKVVFEKDDLSVKVSVSYDIKDEQIFINTYQVQEGIYKEILLFADVWPELSSDNTVLMAYVVVPSAYVESYAKLAENVIVQLKICAELYRKYAEPILQGEKFFFKQVERKPFWKRFLLVK